MNQLSAQVVVSAVVVYLLQLAKKSQLVPWMTAETGTINRVVAVLAALCSSLGIHFSFNAAAGTLLIAGLSIANVGGFAWHWLTAFVSQQLIFQTAVQPKQLSASELATAITTAIAQAPAPDGKTIVHIPIPPGNNSSYVKTLREQSSAAQGEQS